MKSDPTGASRGVEVPPGSVMASKSARKLWRAWILGTIMVKLQIGETVTGVDPDVATKASSI
jgi:hypothetical protein